MWQTSDRNTDAKVDYDDRRGRFTITCPVWDNGRVRALPNRRWAKGSGTWTAPAIRANIEAIDKVYKAHELSDAARAKIDGYASERVGATKRTPFPHHYTFKRKPRAKQWEAMQAAYGKKAFALFMDMRTGKTKVAIDIACAARMEGRLNRVLLVCPLSIRKNWLREFAKDAPIPIDAHLLDTSKPKNFDRWMATPHDFKWLVVGVESLAAGRAIDFCKRFAGSHTRVACIVDESQKIKTPTATRSKNVVSLGRMCEFRICMTGTPLTRNPLDIFMQFEFLDPDIIGLGDFYSFKARYAVMGGYENREIIGYENLDELVELVDPHIYQVRQHEVIDHEKTKVIRTVRMTDEQKAMYRQMKTRSTVGEGDLRMVVQNILEKVLRLQEITGGFVSYLHTEEELEVMRSRLGPTAKLPRSYRVPIDGKNPKLAELLEAAEDYPGKTVVWCAFTDEIGLVARALREAYGEDSVVELHGGVSEEDRDRGVNDRFQRGSSRFIVGNTATGGVGLTLDAADNIFFYSNTHNFGDREQAEERGTADGKSTLIVDFIVEGTVDEVVMESNDAKRDMSEFIRGKIGQNSHEDLFGDV